MIEDPTAVADDPSIWSDVVGQDRVVDQLRTAAKTPVHAYLFVGPAGSGKRTAALAFAAALLGIDAATRGADVARTIELAKSEGHLDLRIFEPEGEKLLKDDVDDIIALSALSPVEGNRKVVVLTDFHRIEDQGARLLKPIEEPQESTVFVILADELVPELVTIASRSVRFEFGPVPTDAIVKRLMAEGVDADLADTAAEAATGDLRRARLLVSDPSVQVRRQAWASIPFRVDGTGFTACSIGDELLAHIDAAQEPLDARHKRAYAELEAQIDEFGLRKTPLTDLTKSQKREVRRHRKSELTFGFATLSRAYRDQLVSVSNPGPLLDALDRIQLANDALLRNPTEALLLQSLLFSLPPAGG